MRGGVYGLAANRSARGHEQQGRRFAIVVQATSLEHLSTWLVVPTSTSARPFSFRPAVELPGGAGETLALCDALSAVDPQVRLGKSIGILPLATMREIDGALALLLELD